MTRDDAAPSSLRERADDVVREHAPAVFRHLKRIFGPRADVDDLMQSVLLEVVRYLPGFEGRARLSTWIHRITLSVAYQELRTRYRLGKHEVALEDPDAHVGDSSVHADVEKKQAAELLYRALDTLPPKKRIAVVLYEIDGLTLREISESLSIPLQTVASQVRTGRAELADAMRALLQGAPLARARDDDDTSSGGRT